VRPIRIDVTQRIELTENEGIWGVTKLRNEIYVLFDTGYSPDVFRIRVFEDRYPFHLQTKIKGEEIRDSTDIVSSEKENCLYFSDTETKCVFKLTREKDDQHKIIKWLTTDYRPETMSVSRDGELLMINRLSHSLMIYGSDAELIRSIPLTRYIKDLYHAVETSIGNFIIMNRQETEKDKHKHWSEIRKDVSNRGYDVSELTRDGQMVIRRFIPSIKTQQLAHNCYLSIDSDDRVFVADPVNDRVILLDSDLKWNRILCPTGEEKEEQRRLFYDEEMKQLIVGGGFSHNSQVNVYTLRLI